MTIGILGAGALGSALARLFTRHGHHTLIANSRGPHTLAQFVAEAGPHLQAATPEAVVASPVVILAVPWPAVAASLPALGPWAGRRVIDATNPVTAPDAPIEPLGGRSSSRVVASTLAGARVVKGFNHLPPPLLQSPAAAGGRRVQFIAGDDLPFKQEVAALMEGLGFLPVDMGDLDAGAMLSQYPGGPLPGLNLVQIT